MSMFTGDNAPLPGPFSPNNIARIVGVVFTMWHERDCRRKASTICVVNLHETPTIFRWSHTIAMHKSRRKSTDIHRKRGRQREHWTPHCVEYANFPSHWSAHSTRSSHEHTHTYTEAFVACVPRDSPVRHVLVWVHMSAFGHTQSKNENAKNWRAKKPNPSRVKE